MKILSCDEVGCPTAGVSQPLRFREVCLFSPQFLGQQLLLCDINCGTVKSLENSIFDGRNTRAANVPHFPGWSHIPLGYVTTTALFMQHADGFRHGGSVIWMNCGKILFKRWGPLLRG